MQDVSAVSETVPTAGMKAVRVHQFGGLEAMTYEEVSQPTPGAGQVLVRVMAAGVGPWDAWVREGKSALTQPLPLTLGSDLSGVVEALGPAVSGFARGDEVFGVTNPNFTGAYAQYAVADAAMLALKPAGLSDIEAASVPVVACTAWQMVFDHGQVGADKRVLVHGAAGNVGAYAVQLAKRTGAEVIATAFTRDLDYVRALGADQVIDVARTRFEETVQDIDIVLDTVGGDTLERSFVVLRRGGVMVSSVAPPNAQKAAHWGIRGVFFLVAVTSTRLSEIAALIARRELATNVGEVLPLTDARVAHKMLAGKPHKRGKIVLVAGE